MPWADATQNSLSLTIDATATPLASPKFEPRIADPSIFISQLLVVALTAAAAAYWWLVVVPSERAALGRSKRLGPLDGYLRELEQPEALKDRRLERWFYTDWLEQRDQRRQKRQQQQQLAAEVAAPGKDAVAARAASADSESGGPASGDADPYDSQQLYEDDKNLLRPSAVTPTPRFFSLDNPIVATAALLLLASALAALTHSG